MQKRELFNRGTKFRVKESVETPDERSSIDLQKGEIVEMSRDDGTDIPFFKTQCSAKECISLDILELVTVSNHSAKTAPKFVLQYDTNVVSKATELLATEKEVRARIAQFAADGNVQRDSIRVHDIKRTRTVTLGVKITIK